MKAVLGSQGALVGLETAYSVGGSYIDLEQSSYLSFQ